MQQKKTGRTLPLKLLKILPPHTQLLPLAGDASSKKFFRLPEHPRKILMVMETHKDGRGSLKDWIQVHKLLSSQGIQVPAILESFPEAKALLLENSGEHTLQKFMKAPHTKDQYEKCLFEALEILKKTRSLSVKSLHLSLSQKELEKDRQLFFHYHIGPRRQKMPSFDESLFMKECLSLEKYLAEQSRYFTHRDFHSGNLILGEKGLSLIDFQDACLGPLPYDFVSFTLDPYSPLSPDERLQFFEKAESLFLSGLKTKEIKTFKDSLKAQSIQRLYKILGSYNYLSAELKKDHYFQFIKPVISILEYFDFYDTRWPYLTSALTKELLHAEKK